MSEIYPKLGRRDIFAIAYTLSNGPEPSAHSAAEYARRLSSELDTLPAQTESIDAGRRIETIEGLSVRPRNALRDAGITTIGELVGHVKQYRIGILRGMGSTSGEEVLQWLVRQLIGVTELRESSAQDVKSLLMAAGKQYNKSEGATQ